MTNTSSEVYADVVLLYKINVFQSWTFLLKKYNILKNNILTCSCWASVESWLLWRYASRSSLLYSGFRYTIELPLQPYKIQVYTFWVQGLAFFLPWFPDYYYKRLKLYDKIIFWSGCILFCYPKSHICLRWRKLIIPVYFRLQLTTVFLESANEWP